MEDRANPHVSESVPVPPAELIVRVAGGPDAEAFLRSGRDSVAELERGLALVGRTLDSFDSILDFGCGCGRMLLWLRELGATRALYGTDIDSDAVSWCQENIPWAHVTVNDAEPPLPYADATFDLVYNHSVFTHIDERRQDLWLTELRRVTRPGALILLSAHGEVALRQADWEIRDRVERDGIAFIDHSLPGKFPLPDWYQNTFHAPWYVFEHWGRWFDVRAYLPGAALGLQDQVLLERPQDSDPRRTPIAARRHLNARAAARVSEALASARAYRERPEARPSRFGLVGKLARTAALRAMRPYSVHEDSVDRAIATSIAELTSVSEQQGARIQALEHRLREASGLDRSHAVD